MFGKREVFVTHDPSKCQAARSRLFDAGIVSYARVNPVAMGSTGQYRGMPFITTSNSHEYRIYV